MISKNSMTVQNIISWFSNHPRLIIGYFILLTILSLIGLLLIKPKHFKPPLSYLYGILIYAVTIPGLLSLVLILYSFFFLKTNLLQLDLVTYFIPFVAMLLILWIINKTIPIKNIPGFSKLSGHYILILITFIFTYILQRMFFGVFFIAKFEYLIL